jgi:hypothetical protein
MSGSQDPMDPMALLEQKIEEAGLDLTDVQVHDVIAALSKVLARHLEMTLQLLKRARRVKHGKMSMSKLEAWVKEQESKGGVIEHFKRLLLEAEVDFDDEAVIEAMAVAIDVLIQADNFIGSILEFKSSEQP